MRRSSSATVRCATSSSASISGPIGEFPYKSITEVAMLAGRSASTWVRRRGHEVGLLMNPHGRVVGAPVIASHVGGDTAADLVAVEFATGQGIRMLIDIGTNTEVVVTDGTRFLAASCPAGPAFEGRPAALRDVRRRWGHRDDPARGRGVLARHDRRCRPGRDLRLGTRRRPRRTPAGALDERGGPLPRRSRRVPRRAGAGHHVLAVGREPARTGQGRERMWPADPAPSSWR